MASEDVIELGSSEDEAEPAPKKRKPTPNAMVHIPANIPGLTIKPSKSNHNSSKNKCVLSKPMVIRPSKPIISNIRLKTNVITGMAQCNTNIKLKNNALSVNKPTNPTVLKKDASKEYLINPVRLAKNLKQSQMVKKVSGSVSLKKPFNNQGTKILNNLPPSITITKTQTKKQVQVIDIPMLRSTKPNIIIKKKIQVPTVNLDEEVNVNVSKTNNPQWYMSPEESVETTEVNVSESIIEPEPSIEEQDNTKTEVTKYVEITIEDSPIKSFNHLDSEIGRELPITIEDSPIKPKKKNSEDKEKIKESNSRKNPQSKKKLDYPNDLQKSEDIYEIEIDSMEPCVMPSDNVKDCELTTSIEGSLESTVLTKDKEVNEGPSSIEKAVDKLPVDVTGISEFHAVYQEFIDTCFKLENSEDMKIIVEKKIKTYYKQCPKEYVESEEFIDMVSSKITSMKAGPEKMYLYIKDIVDELNLQRKMAKSDILNKEINTNETNNKLSCGDYGEYDSKKQRQIRKLEKTIKKLHKAIQKLEEQEVDFEDEDDSVYLLTERYKERMVRVHAKFCQLTNTKMPSEPRIVIEARIGRPAGPAKKLEKWINKKLPIGTPLPFPDFHDVLHCVREANEEDKLGWNEIDIMEEARDLFARCGKKLQRRRQENEWRIAASRITSEVDPAEISDELKSKLKENKLVATKKESEVLNSFVDRQHQLKLEAEEIGDKEADESPVESEDEEPNDNCSLGDKSKRKVILKKLLSEKNKKVQNSPKRNENESESQADDKQNETGIENSKHSDSEEMKNLHTDENKGLCSEDNLSNNEKNNIENVNSQISLDDSKISSAANIVVTAEDEDDLNNNEDNVETVSDSSIESDIDELHLLQKLHSETEANSSTCDSSDSDTPIAISDTLDSDSEEENLLRPYDVISIENSSYSESETNVEGEFENDNVNEMTPKIESLVNANLEIEFPTEKSVPKINSTSSNEDDNENILLASSDEDGFVDKDSNLGTNETCINLKDDAISISETVILGVKYNEVNNKQDNDKIIQLETSPLNVIPLSENTIEMIDNVNNKNITYLKDSCNSLDKTDKDAHIEELDRSETNNDRDLEQNEIDKHKNIEMET